MRRLINTNYPYHVWIKSILLGSIGMIISFIFYADARSFDSYIGFIMVTIFMSAILSWLTFLLCYLIFKRLILTNTSPKKIKIIMCCLSIAGMILTCVIFGIDLFKVDIDTIIPASYLIG